MVQMQLGYEAASNLLRKGLPATGIVAANDYNAHSFMKAAKKAGYRSGVDYAIIGFDDFPESRTLGLTTVHPPLDAMGREAVAMLFRAIDDPRLTLRTCLPSDLIARESTMAFA